MMAKYDWGRRYEIFAKSIQGGAHPWPNKRDFFQKKNCACSA
jgi:hypothetical protein